MRMNLPNEERGSRGAVVQYSKNLEKKEPPAFGSKRLKDMMLKRSRHVWGLVFNHEQRRNLGDHYTEKKKEKADGVSIGKRKLTSCLHGSQRFVRRAGKDHAKKRKREGKGYSRWQR